MVTEGVFTSKGEFIPLPTPATYILPDIKERFRQLLLKRLHRSFKLGRLSVALGVKVRSDP
jgi:hypothetical protein